jgi:hypothetical protein
MHSGLNATEQETMRVYVRTTTQIARRLLDQGRWEDLYTDADLGEVGIYCEDRPRGLMRAAPGTGVLIGGPEGEAVLRADGVPEELFREREVQETTRSLTHEEWERFANGALLPTDLEYQRMGYAIIPAEVLNRFGPPRLYDHDSFAPQGRVNLVRAIRTMEQDDGAREHVQEMRDALDFLDHVGWDAPLCVREPAQEDYLAPPPWFRLRE